MGEPACLMRSFSYNHTPIPNNQIKMMNWDHAHGFGGCVASVEFVSDSSGCEKWSDVSKKRYVEEAKSYTQPGSVAEKKAFFDDFYKKIAAQKAAAAALLEQEKAAAAAEADTQQVTSKVVDLEIESCIANADAKNADSLNIKNLKVSQTERRLLKFEYYCILKSKPNADEKVRQPIIKKKTAYYRKDNISTPRTKNVTTNDYTDKRRLAPKSLKVWVNSSFVKEPCSVTQSTKVSSVNSTPKRAVTPMKTPAKEFVKEENKQPSATLSVNRIRRIETHAHATVVGSKSTGLKLHNLSAVSEALTAYKSKLKSPIISSPFVLRSEDRGARRKQKLEEKFNEKQAKVVQQKAQFKEKAETEIRTLRESSCFKALPLPDFYKGREAQKKILGAFQNRSHYEKHPRRF